MSALFLLWNGVAAWLKERAQRRALRSEAAPELRRKAWRRS
jgi:hypothetical protein